MHLARFFSIFLILFVATATNAADTCRPLWFTNQTAIANGVIVLAAVHSTNLQAKAQIHGLVGSPVIFVGGASPLGGNANLIAWSNVVIAVEIYPLRHVRPNAAVWDAEVLGTLKGVDFENRIVHIQAKPEDWKVREVR